MKLVCAGASHGSAMTGIIAEVPSKLNINFDRVNDALKERNNAFGRSARQKEENDSAVFLSGIREGVTDGGNISFIIENSPSFRENSKTQDDKYSIPRPNHADLSGMLKYGFADSRCISENASARRTCLFVGAGAVAMQMLETLGIYFAVYAKKFGSFCDDNKYTFGEAKTAKSPLYVHKQAEMVKKICSEAEENGDSVGGVVRLYISGLKSGFGDNYNRLSADLSSALFSIPSVKGISFGDNLFCESLCGFDYADCIYYEDGDYKRRSNHTGGIDGGMSNGEDIIIDLAIKPVPTIKKSLESVNVKTKEKVTAPYFRADTTSVFPVCAIAPYVAALCLSDAVQKRLGGDSIEQIKQRYKLL